MLIDYDTENLEVLVTEILDVAIKKTRTKK
jgi:hypothetical protein